MEAAASNLEGRTMAANNDEVMRQRTRERMEGDFLPVHDRMNFPKPEERIAAAAEYAAYQLGQIRKSLERIAAGYPAKN